MNQNTAKLVTTPTCSRPDPLTQAMAQASADAASEMNIDATWAAIENSPGHTAGRGSAVAFFEALSGKKIGGGQ